jgi:hypothetical protein
MDILLTDGSEWVRFMDRSRPPDDDGREEDFWLPWLVERANRGNPLVLDTGVTGELSKGELRSSAGDDVVLVLVLVVVVEGVPLASGV